MTTHRALGRGLNALIPERISAPSVETSPADQQLIKLRVAQIRPNPFQPRVAFNPEKQQELIDSMRERGMIQPVIVRQTKEGYELVAGERRLRAVKALGWVDVPAVVRATSDQEALEISLLENIQRDDLNPVEEAKAFERLATEFGLTQEAIAKAMGRERSSISNALRILKLPDKIIDAIRNGIITSGHAKALLSIETQDQQLAAFDQMVKGEFSVRKAEALTRHPGRSIAKRHRSVDPNIRALQEQLQHALGTKVNILHGKKRGQIIIEYYSNADLDRLVETISR